MGMMSLGTHDASPHRIVHVLRRYWHSKNKAHWVRDVAFDEDRSHAHTGALPQVPTTRRTTAINLLRRAGETTIAAACRRCAAHPWHALALRGLTPPLT